MRTPPDDSTRTAYLKWQRQAEESHTGRKRCIQRQEELEDLGSYFNDISYQVQDTLFAIGDDRDEEWKRTLLHELDNLTYSRNEAFDVLWKENDRLEEEKQELKRKEDDCHLAYEQSQAKATLEEDRKRKEHFL